MTQMSAKGVSARAVTIQKPLTEFTGRAVSQAKTPVTTGYSICPAPRRMTSLPEASMMWLTAPWYGAR
ncbi:hypothetical protein JCM9957A_01370 [Kineosporia succinea]